MKIKLIVIALMMSFSGIVSAMAQVLTYTHGIGAPSSVPPNLLNTSGTLTAQSGSFRQESSAPIT